MRRFYICVNYATPQIESAFKVSQIKIIGHRGMGPQTFDGYTENTLRSYNGAIRRGADGIEVDLHLTSDGVPMCLHSGDLPKKVLINPLTKGRPSIDCYTEKEIDTLFRVGSNGSKIPSFLSFLEWASACNEKRSGSNLPPLLLNIELKDTNISLPSQVHETITNFVRKKNIPQFLNTIVFNSFNHEHLKEIKTLNPNYNTVPNFKTAFLFNPSDVGLNFQVPAKTQYRRGLFQDLLMVVKDLNANAIDIVIDDIRHCSHLNLFDFLQKNQLGLFTSTSLVRLEPQKIAQLLRKLVFAEKYYTIPQMVFKADNSDTARQLIETLEHKGCIKGKQALYFCEQAINRISKPFI